MTLDVRRLRVLAGAVRIMGFDTLLPAGEDRLPNTGEPQRSTVRVALDKAADGGRGTGVVCVVIEEGWSEFSTVLGVECQGSEV